MRFSSFTLCLTLTLAVRAQSPPLVAPTLKDAPLTSEDRSALAKALAEHNYPAESAVITRALTVNPNSSVLWLLAGRVAFLEKHPKDAAIAIERAERIRELDESDRMTLALAYQYSGRIPEARTQLTRLTRAAPGNARYFYLLAALDRESSHLEDAATGFRKVIQLEPGMMRAREQLAQCQELLGHTEEARKTYEEAAALNRKQSAKWEGSPLDLGVFLFRAGDLENAAKLFREALQYNPRVALGHYYLGQIFQKQGRDNDAVTEYRAAVVHQPALLEAWTGLSLEYTRLGMQSDAESALTIARKLQSGDLAQKSPSTPVSAIK